MKDRDDTEKLAKLLARSEMRALARDGKEAPVPIVLRSTYNRAMVRYPPGHRKNTRARIVEAAARLFKAGGFAATGLDAVMAEVGLTAGGFYAHFTSKRALFAEALEASLAAQSRRSTDMNAEASDAEWVRGFIAGYLSESHRDGAAIGCSIPCLAPDVARADGSARLVFEGELRRFVPYLAKRLGPRAAFAAPVFVLCIGGVMLARAVADRDYSSSILASCRAAALQLAGLTNKSLSKGRRT
jgi:TetR/AcrR family transcriptional repressor of nem operon